MKFSLTSAFERLKTVVIGQARDLYDPAMFHKLSLIAFFAWVGLGADGLSSSCYGPQEAFLALGDKFHLALFVALGTAITVFVISASYSQVIELFPGGGGGYVVASKTLSPHLGMAAGCALLIDYVLTIAISVASGADALFSMLPPDAQRFKLYATLAGVFLLIALNLRGVKESVVPLVPIFLVFVLTHAVAILYAVVDHTGRIPDVASGTVADVQSTVSTVGLWGLMLLLLKSYSHGAGTYTGIEAVSAGMPLLREPRVKTGKRTMMYMAVSLAFVAFGLMLAYVLYAVDTTEVRSGAKTINAVLFGDITSGWGKWGYVFVIVTLISEAAILFVAAQTGFLGGPRILANMALDRWLPTRFAMLSDRLVTQDGILLMGGAAVLILILTGGSVKFLVVLYAINVFIDFALSQSGLVKYWWTARARVALWRRRMLIAGCGLCLTLVILCSMIVLKFREGGWITLALTGSLAVVALLIRRHYDHTIGLLKRLDALLTSGIPTAPPEAKARIAPAKTIEPFDPQGKTAVVLVSGFNGLGLHTLAAIHRMFGGVFKNYVFVQVGIVDAGNYKGVEELGHLEDHVNGELHKYVNFMRHEGHHAEGFGSIGTDLVEEVQSLVPKITEKYPSVVFFGGQLVFAEESVLTRMLHNNVVFALQKRLYRQGIPFVILPLRV